MIRTRIWQNCTCRLRRLWHHKILYFPRSLAFERPRANWTSTEWCAPRTIPCLPKVASRRSDGSDCSDISEENPMEAETLGRLMQAELNKVRDPKWAKMHTWEDVKLCKFTQTNDKFLTLALILLCVCDRICCFLLGFSFSWEIGTSFFLPQTGLAVGFSSKRRRVHICSRKSVSLGWTMWTALWLIFAS